MREILTKFQAGYPGHDSMREKAERMFREEMDGSGIHIPVPMSASAPGRLKARLYNKGGAVCHEDIKHPRSKHHRLSHTQKDLVLPKRKRTPKLNIESFEEEEHMKKGGRARKRYGIGGALLEAVSPVLTSTRRLSDVYRDPQALGLKKGGKACKNSRKYSNGGDVFGDPMDGERPSRTPRHFDYERHMDGEHAMKRGGRTCKAAGGVAKVRHGQATLSGKQINRKVVKGR